MRTPFLLVMIGLLGVSCNPQSQDINPSETKESQDNIVEAPKGNWKVDKTYDDNGNLIKYDSIYSWSSNDNYDKLSPFERDSLMQAFKSRFFTSFSRFENDGFDPIFSNDSLFSQHYFNADFFGSDFGSDVMAIDKMRQQMIARQKAFLEKYQSEFLKPEDEN